MTNQPRILLSPPHLGEEERRLVGKVFDSNWIAPVGPDVDAFEREICESTGIEHACALASGTAGIHLALRLLGVRPGDLVLCSSMTFVASANPILMCGAIPVFVDSEPGSWCMSVAALKRALERLTASGTTPKACVAVSLYGQAADLPAIENLCREHGVKLLDEAAEALGAMHGDRMAGTFGDLGVYSFNGNKIITTSGGGALVGHDEALIQQARFLATQARDPSPIGAYEHSTPGFNYRLSNVLAAIGRGQLRVLPDRVEARRRIFERYREGLRDIEQISWMPEAGYGRGTRWLSCGQVRSAEQRDQLLKHLDENGIEARPAWKPMHLQPLFADCDYEAHSVDEDVCAGLFASGFCLPSGSALEPSDQDRVIGVIRDLFE
jgi:pyridoxal phosphate-dependent aminotransferase EpsN